VNAFMMPKGSPSFGKSKLLRLITLKNPEGPSKIRLGPSCPLRELGRENRLAARLRRCEILPVGQGSDAALVERRVAAHRDADGVNHLLWRKPHQPARADDAGKAQDRGLVETKSSGIEHIERNAPAAALCCTSPPRNAPRLPSLVPCRRHADYFALHGIVPSTQIILKYLGLLARPERFELPTPRFVVREP
jgi:hypothetical protein